MNSALRINNRVAIGKASINRARLTAGIVLSVTLLVPLFLSRYNYSVREVALAMILLDVCLYPTYRYFFHRETGLPILPVLCLSFALQYSAPILTNDPGLPTAFGFRVLEGSDIEAALALTIVGIIILEITYYFVSRNNLLKALPSANLPMSKGKTEIFCLAVLAVSIFLPRLQTAFSQDTYLQFQAMIVLFQNQVLVVISLLGWLVYSGQGRRWHRLLLYVVIAVAAFRGFSTTMIEMMILPLAVFFMTRWLYLRRLPIVTLALITFLFIFLSPVKKDIRGNIVQGGAAVAETTTTDRASDWISQAIDYWRDTLNGTRDLAESTSDAANRTDQIHNFAHIYSLTPSVLPYQNGSTYSYLLIAWVPRIIWPEKPQANEANNYYAVAYEISTEEGIKTSSFGVSLIGEGYMNFGVTGVVLVMLVLATTLAVLQHIFAGPASGPGGQAIFLATFVYFLNGIGTSAELMFGGLIQNLVCASILLWLVKQTNFRKIGMSASRVLRMKTS
ncbi:MAG TPA: O-antigen polysaccharide polymerase Wzy [Pyrinomonadaceae bacterium]|nr:O-antigen polysaccharide polymerase Wzy [Pyrinomonadaceae bacterium]